MPSYKYECYTKEGKVVRGYEEAGSRQALLQELTSRGLMVSEIKEQKTLATRKFSGFTRKKRNYADYFFQLSLLMNSGIPLVEAHNIIAKTIRSQKEKAIIQQTAEKVSQGVRYSESLSSHGDYYDPMYTNLIKASEMVGNLPQVLMDIAEYEENKKKNADKLKSALIYPATVLIIGMGIMVFLLSVVVPRIVKIFISSGRELPAVTKFVIGSSNFLRNYGLFILVLILAASVMLRYFYTRRGEFNMWVDKKIYAFNFAAWSFVARFSHVLAFQLKEGLPLTDALHYAAGTVRNRYFRDNIANIRKAVLEGVKFSDAVKSSGIFPDLFPAAVTTGESSGNMPDLLERVAGFYNRQIQKYTSTFLSVVEPLFIVFLGGMVGLVVMAIMFPLFDLNSNL